VIEHCPTKPAMQAGSTAKQGSWASRNDGYIPPSRARGVGRTTRPAIRFSMTGRGDL
jgi:hypothetical protein